MKRSVLALLILLAVSVNHPREVCKAAILANAAGVLVGHNHPSGR